MITIIYKGLPLSYLKSYLYLTSILPPNYTIFTKKSTDYT